jgi:hypothetical protein
MSFQGPPTTTISMVRGTTIRFSDTRATILSTQRGENDLIDAGPSNSYDDVYGGRGADTFRFYEDYGVLQIEDFRVSDGDKLDLSHTGFERSDLKDTQDNDRDGDGYYMRVTSANGIKELQFYFHNGSGTFDEVQLEDISLKQLKHDVKEHPSHYDFA